MDGLRDEVFLFRDGRVMNHRDETCQSWVVLHGVTSPSWVYLRDATFLSSVSLHVYGLGWGGRGVHRLMVGIVVLRTGIVGCYLWRIVRLCTPLHRRVPPVDKSSYTEGRLTYVSLQVTWESGV